MDANTLVDWITTVFEVGVVVVAAASAIAAATPTDKDDAALRGAKKFWHDTIVPIINVLALNVGGARNVTQEKAEKDA